MMRVVHTALLLVMFGSNLQAQEFIRDRARSSVQLIERDAATPLVDGHALMAAMRAAARAQNVVLAQKFTRSSGSGLEGLTHWFITAGGRDGRLDVLSTTPARKGKKQIITMSVRLESPRSLSEDDAALLEAIMQQAVSQFPAFQVHRIKN